MDDVAKTISTLEKDFPPSAFDIVMHLTIHLVEEVFLCSPVATRWMYPIERYLKGLKSYIKNRERLEGNMAHGYLRNESLGYLTKYLA